MYCKLPVPYHLYSTLNKLHNFTRDAMDQIQGNLSFDTLPVR